jgi:hypothetical protein
MKYGNNPALPPVRADSDSVRGHLDAYAAPNARRTTRFRCHQHRAYCRGGGPK